MKSKNYFEATETACELTKTDDKTITEYSIKNNRWWLGDKTYKFSAKVLVV